MPGINSSAMYRGVKLAFHCAMATAVVGVGAAAFAPVTASAIGVNDFDVWNLTGHNVTLYTYEQRPGINVSPRSPKVPTVIEPGKNVHFAYDWRFDEEQRPRFQNVDTQQNWRVEVRPGTSDGGMTCAGLSGPNANCSPLIGKPGVSVALWDAKGTDYVVPPQEAQHRADVLNNLCANDYAAKGLDITCNYTDMDPEATHGPLHIPAGFGPPEAGNAKMQTTAKWEDKVTTTTTFSASASASAKIWGIINAAVEAKYSKTITQEKSFSQSVKLTIDPFNKGYICVGQALTHYRGTLKVSTKNSTWELPGVDVTTADPAGGPIIKGFQIPVKDNPPQDACASKPLVPLN